MWRFRPGSRLQPGFSDRGFIPSLPRKYSRTRAAGRGSVLAALHYHTASVAQRVGPRTCGPFVEEARRRFYRVYAAMTCESPRAPCSSAQGAARRTVLAEANKPFRDAIRPTRLGVHHPVRTAGPCHGQSGQGSLAQRLRLARACGKTETGEFHTTGACPLRGTAKILA